MSGWDDLERRLFAGIRARLDEDLTALPPEMTRVSVTKYGARVPVSTDLLMAEGLIPDTRPARPRRAPVRVTSWSLVRDLAGLRVRAAVAGVRLRAGSWIAGVDLAGRDEPEEDW